jgi:alkaline phosphatase D
MAAGPPVLDLGAAHRGTPEIDCALLATARPAGELAGFFQNARQVFAANPQARFADLPELADAAEAAGLRLTGGPMLGERSESGVLVWVRTTRPAEVEVTVETPDGARRFGPVASNAASDLAAVVPVTGLAPGSRYPYAVAVDGRAVPLPPGSAIPALHEAGRPGLTRIIFGADFHKTGLWNQALLGQMRARQAAAVLLLGDLAADDRNALVGLHRSDYLLRDLSPGWRALAAATAVHATWDDHDYFDNDLSGIPPGFTAADRAAVRAVWHENWVNPGRDPGAADRGIQFRTRVGPCDVIMLDTRSQRVRPGAPDAFLGPAQARWLERELAACTGPFVILTGGTMWSDNISNGKDSWGKWDPAGRERIFSLIEKHRLAVLLLSGDRHGARVLRIPRPSGRPLWEFEMGSLGGHPGPPAFGADRANQPFGLTGEALFGEFTFDTSGPGPAVTMRALDAAGTVRHTVTLTQADLAAPPDQP